MTLTNSELSELETLLSWEEQTRNFPEFVRQTFPRIQWGWFYDHLCQVLSEFMAAVILGKSPRLIVNVPPRHGKSEICTIRFPLWAMLNNPGLEVIACSYAQSLAIEFSRKARALVFDPYVEGLWGVRSRGGTFTAEKWSLTNKSSYQSTSVLGSIVGKGAHILLIDDPLKNIVEADSAIHRNKIYEWYGSAALTRLAPGAGVILIMQRWHELDLTGQLLRAEHLEGGDKWTHIEYQAIAENDERWRKKGEALLPSRYSVPMLRKLEANMVTRAWRANYQQRPTRKGGNVFQETWFQRYRQKPVFNPTDQVDWFSSWDLRFGKSQAKGSSYVCGQVWARVGATKYLIDQVRGKWDFVQTLEAFDTLAKQYPQCHCHLVEDKANGPAMESILCEKISGIILRKPKGDKVQRAEAAQPTSKAGNVWIPDPDYFVWAKIWLDEITQFPGGEDDDQVDCMSQAIVYMLENERAIEEVVCVNMFSIDDDD